MACHGFRASAVVDLLGSSEQQGDLKSIVLHKMALRSQQSSYPIALGVRISGVDDATFSQTGEAFSTITLPDMNSHNELSLQEDDTALAYECVQHHFVLTHPLHHNSIDRFVLTLCLVPCHTRSGAQVPRVTPPIT